MKNIFMFIMWSLCTISLSADYSHADSSQHLIIGKWEIYERTDIFDFDGAFSKADYYVSLEYKKNGEYYITVKDEQEGPYPYKIKGNKIIFRKEGLEGESEILEVTKEILMLKSAVRISKYKRVK